MGLCASCFKSSSTDLVTPDMETRRMQQAEAAERRLREQESRGVKDPERLRFQQQRRLELEKKMEENPGGGGGLRWQVD